WGARAAWILQNTHVAYIQTATATTTLSITSTPGFLDVYARNHSWAIGPRSGLMMDWLLGGGFRLFGSGYGDILYTKYKIQDKTVLLPSISTSVLVEGATLVTTAGVPISMISKTKLGALRPHLDLEMGIGWGSYFDDHNWHVDLAASYGFQVFFNQNM